MWRRRGSGGMILLGLRRRLGSVLGIVWRRSWQELEGVGGEGICWQNLEDLEERYDLNIQFFLRVGV